MNESNCGAAIPHPPVHSGGGYSELAMSGDGVNQSDYVLPILSRLSYKSDERWLTCVNTPGLDKDLAAAANIRSDSLLRLQSSNKIGATELIKRALSAGRSHTVIGYCRDLTQQQRRELKQCAESAGCQCLVLTG